MSATVLSTFLTFTFVTAFTPGPNNILALNSGSRYGFQGSLPVMLGICTGFFYVMCLCGAIALSVSVISEKMIMVMKYIGCIYMLWLAWKIASAKTEDIDTGIKTGFMNGFILQFVNIKIITSGLAAFSGFVLPYYDTFPAIIAFILILSLIGNAGTLTWAVAGSALQRFFKQNMRTANSVMGLMLLFCAVNMLL